MHGVMVADHKLAQEGFETLSISRSEREWSASCLPSQFLSSGDWNRTNGFHVAGVRYYQQ